MTTAADLDIKQERLLALLRDLGSVIVAYSGGADSSHRMRGPARILPEVGESWPKGGQGSRGCAQVGPQ